MRRALVASLGVASLLMACTVMNGLKVRTEEAPTEEVDDGGKSKKKDAASSATEEPGGCHHATVPAKPAAATPGGTDTQLTFAVQTIVPNNDGTPNGFDLDGLCTCEGDAGPDPDTCKRPAGQGSACDYPGNGLDNQGSLIFKGINSAGGVNLIDLENRRIANGVSGLLLHVEGYNGLADDDALTVSLIRSAGIDGGPVSGTVQPWPVSDTSYSATEAYVANKVLVARFTAVEVPFLSDTPAPAKMNGAILSGTIGDGNKITELVLGGRSNTAELVNSVGELVHPVFGFALCQYANNVGEPDLFRNFGALACQGSDMPTDPSKDRDPNTGCDALSFGLRLLMVPAELGGNVPLAAVEERCVGQGGEQITCP